MGEVLKVLGQATPAAGTLTTLYTVPASTSTVISSVVISNVSTSTTFRLSVAVSGAADAASQYLYYDLVLSANDTFVAMLGITLATTDVLRGSSASGLVNFNIFGAEET